MAKCVWAGNSFTGVCRDRRRSGTEHPTVRQRAVGRCRIARPWPANLNRETSGGDFPADALHFTYFGPNRKDPLTRSLLISPCEDRIQSMNDALTEKNIKKSSDVVRST